MKILVTGSNGFIGKNLIATLNNIRTGKDKSYTVDKNIIIYEYSRASNEQLLDVFCSDCDFIFHLAGVNRPKTETEFMEGNYNLTLRLLQLLEKHNNTCPILVSSSIQAALDNPYGKSKKAGEDLIFEYGKRRGVTVFVYRFPNVFGKWCKPNYNSVVATFCYNIANNLPIHVNDRNVKMKLVYIDDVVSELINALCGHASIDQEGYNFVPKIYTATLGQIVNYIYSFRKSREELSVPNMKNGELEKALYATYLSYLPTKSFSYPLKMNIDERGSFTEILRTKERGQFSVNISKPGIVKGEHWHHTKTEKFVVVSGKGLIQFRKVDSTEIIDYHVSGEKLVVVDIPTGYTHNIINEGDTDLVTFMWCSECFDPEKPDTYFLKVNER